MQRESAGACFPRAMAALANTAIFLILAVILVQLCRPNTVETKDVQVWTDDVERRLMRDIQPRNYH
jgi:hypothetical protein